MTHGAIDPTDGTEIEAHTFTEFSTLDSVFQSPVVGQATDDDGDGIISPRDIPDIAVLMGDEFAAYESPTADSDEYYSAIRLISGDGSAVHASVLWDEFDGVDYAPYLFAGIAMANIDADPYQEIITIVRSNTRFACFPALYEVRGDTIELQHVATEVLDCEAHSPALADMDSDGTIEIIFGDRVYDSETLTELWRGTD